MQVTTNQLDHRLSSITLRCQREQTLLVLCSCGYSGQLDLDHELDELHSLCFEFEPPSQEALFTVLSCEQCPARPSNVIYLLGQRTTQAAISSCHHLNG